MTDACFEAANRLWAPLRSRGELPHLYKPGGTYFVTFCLRDTGQPARVIRPPGPAGADGAPDPEAAGSENPERIAASSEPDPTAGSCRLRRPEIAAIVATALRYFAGDRYALHAFCVMPNHVHVVVTPCGGHTLSDITHSWKSYTANRINSMLGQREAVWERESFDHLVRNVRSLRRFVDYTEQNPVKAGLCAAPEAWLFSSAHRGE